MSDDKFAYPITHRFVVKEVAGRKVLYPITHKFMVQQSAEPDTFDLDKFEGDILELYNVQLPNELRNDWYFVRSNFLSIRIVFACVNPSPFLSVFFHNITSGNPSSPTYVRGAFGGAEIDGSFIWGTDTSHLSPPVYPTTVKFTQLGNGLTELYLSAENNYQSQIVLATGGDSELAGRPISYNTGLFWLYAFETTPAVSYNLDEGTDHNWGEIFPRPNKKFTYYNTDDEPFQPGESGIKLIGNKWKYAPWLRY